MFHKARLELLSHWTARCTLDAGQDAEAAKLFLSQMIAHHEGAVMMAKTEISQGKYPDAVQLSKSIVTSQEAEIQEMKGLLASF